jgi:hypothetical protein
VGDQASSNRSKALAAARGGARAGQAEMAEDLGNHGGVYDGGDDSQGAAAMGGSVPGRYRTSVYESPPWLSPCGAGVRRSKPLPAVL